MNFFDEAALRLKQQLAMTQDKDVAKVLGLTPRAWAGRKKLATFPVKELRALAQQRPELQIDVDYVLTGGLAGPNVAVALGHAPRDVMGRHAIEALGPNPGAVMGAAAAEPMPGNGAQAVLGDEARLLAAFRASDSAGRVAVLTAAEGVALLAKVSRKKGG